MNIGMLWFNNDPKQTLSDKVAGAADFYRTKYGKVPNLCFVHPSMLPKETVTVEKQTKNIVLEAIEIRGSRSVLPNHFWIGVNDG